ncbi:MAG: TraR/DksA family transcriptional regulator [Gammaproteobacteria bacterium]|nr:TraR/DksA family transcriptional regulator [Gammaproteobacteria bacterium]MDH5345322.1 TraR/DksA family transcriptional regulator [Gammaproteobacteria bacterium]
MSEPRWPEGLKERLEAKRDELSSRLDRITANVRRSLDSDSEERAKQLADSEVVDALGNETRAELGRISRALGRLQSGDYGLCRECGAVIAEGRIAAYPYAEECIDCAELDEDIRSRT